MLAFAFSSSSSIDNATRVVAALVDILSEDSTTVSIFLLNCLATPLCIQATHLFGADILYR